MGGDFKIKDAQTLHTEKRIDIDVNFGGVDFTVGVYARDGKVQGNSEHGYYTAYLTYFNKTPKEEIKNHFEAVKDYIENNYSQF